MDCGSPMGTEMLGTTFRHWDKIEERGKGLAESLFLTIQTGLPVKSVKS